MKGYGTSQLHDPISLSHQPFCQSLRVFGLFAKTPPAVAYKVQIAVADEDQTRAGVLGKMSTDPLYNLEWDDVARHWDVRYMGPDPSDLPGLSAFPPHVYRVSTCMRLRNRTGTNTHAQVRLEQHRQE